MQAPLRKGKKEETLGRAHGVTRTGRSLLFGLLLVSIVALSSLTYTWQRLVVESMLGDNHALEKRLDATLKNASKLECEVAELEALDRIESRARNELGMTPIHWDDVIVIEEAEVASR
jgi:cell division protein FtsL